MTPRDADASADTLAVVIPTWRRASSLAVCLRAVAAQTRPPDRVLVVHKADDHETAALLHGPRDAWGGLRVGVVIVPPQGNFLTQLNAGIAATTERFVALTDDDAEPRPDWLRRMLDHFADPDVVGVGGRDWQPHERGDRRTVGTINWCGRVTGNHHLGAGPVRAVDLLKGVNWAFRGSVLREVGVDDRLRGSGTVMNTEMAVCFALRRRGMKLIYDPAVAVDHHVAPRPDGDMSSRGGFDPVRHRDAVHNETLATLDYLPNLRRWAFLIWAAAIGTRSVPGVLQLARLTLTGRPHSLGRFKASVDGRVAGIRTFRRGQRTRGRSGCGAKR